MLPTCDPSGSTCKRPLSTGQPAGTTTSALVAHTGAAAHTPACSSASGHRAGMKSPLAITSESANAKCGSSGNASNRWFSATPCATGSRAGNEKCEMRSSAEAASRNRSTSPEPQAFATSRR